MRRRMTNWAALSFVLALAMPLWAQDTSSKPKGPDRPDRVKAEMEHLQALFKDLKLNETQQKQVDQILQTHRQAVTNWAKEHGEDLRNAKTKLDAAGKDPAKRQAAMEEMSKALSGRQELQDNLVSQLSEALTKEQMDKVRAALLPPPRKNESPFPALDQIKLDDKQKEQVAEIRRQAEADAQKAPDPAARKKIWMDAMEKIRTTVLTDEQRQVLQNIRDRFDAFAALKELHEQLKLSDDQKAKIEPIVQAARDKLAAAKGMGDKRQIIQNGWRSIQEVLTPEQRAMLERWRRDHRNDGVGMKVHDRAGRDREAATAGAGAGA